jgi:hypothetical protein
VLCFASQKGTSGKKCRNNTATSICLDTLSLLLGNRASFGHSGAVAPLVLYLTTNDLEVHRSTSVALFQLSKDPWNCVTMHQNGVVPHLLRLIGKA